MKIYNNIFIFSLFVVPILFSSCTIVLPVTSMQLSKKNKITHSDLMGQYDTKKDVIRKFGFTNNKQNEEGVEIWYYNFGTVTNSNTRISGNKKTNINSNYSGVNVNSNLSGYGNTTTSSYKKYAEFQFEGDQVVNWRTKGLNYGNYEKRKQTAVMWYLGGLLIDGAIAYWYFVEGPGYTDY